MFFIICILGLIAVIPIYFLSLEHLKLQKRYGKEKGFRIGKILGLISGWGFFLFWLGIWISPQPRFAIFAFDNLSILVPVTEFSIPLFHLVIYVPFFSIGAWFGIKGVEATGLKAAEIHRSEKIVSTGVYSIVRHPQYFGGLLAHVGFSFLLSALFSLLFTPLIILLVYVISRKEEKELLKDFDKEYEEYRKKVPMLIPKLRN